LQQTCQFDDHLNAQKPFEPQPLPVS